MPVQFFIAFYRTGDPRKYHWVLVATDDGVPSPTEPMKCFEIVPVPVLDASGSETTVAPTWEPQHGKRTKLADTKYQGLLMFPPCTDPSLTLEGVHNILETVPAMPPLVAQNEMERLQWTCAKWIIDLFHEFGPMWGLDFVPRTMESETTLYYEIYKQAYKLEGNEEGFYSTVEVARDGSKVKCVHFPEKYLRTV
ncbi:hypothetical protein PENSPDRAFT_272732 [Peniophora sp. CONT]|nr:hypothetical protein PENSPDRAFT_272732 [Peniophora sp. CONT]